MAEDEQYATIREILGDYIGKRVVDITQHDAAEWEAERFSYILIQFDDGSWVKFPIGDVGFWNGDGDDDPSDFSPSHPEGQKD